MHDGRLSRRPYEIMGKLELLIALWTLFWVSLRVIEIEYLEEYKQETPFNHLPGISSSGKS
ncbi:MAG: hypothetical protein AMJ88_16220 [Anaerolineae bacterium SM23_ 63]|nr:MAG: hypothetical protein AMJ88_16220 [Anaerolineae bacterium SM23_ 63]